MAAVATISGPPSPGTKWLANDVTTATEAPEMETQATMRQSISPSRW